MYLHQGGHGGNPPADMLNRWFSHYLYGVDNGVEKDPPVWIVQDAAAQEPRAVAAAAACGRCAARARSRRFRGGDRPRTRARTRQRRFRRRRSRRSRCRARCRSSSIRRRAGRHCESLIHAPRSGTDKLVDDVALSGSANASADQSPNRLLYATPMLHRHRAHLGHAARDAAHRVERAGREPERLARDAAVRLGARRLVEPRRASSRAAGRTSRITDLSRRAGTTTRSSRASRSCRASSTISRSTSSPTTNSFRPGKRLARDDHVERSRVHAVAASRAPS